MNQKEQAGIAAITSHVPEHRLNNETLAAQLGDWTAEQILEKTGIAERCVAGSEECASDLAVRACEKLFAEEKCSREDIDIIVLCTQSPDYVLPNTAASLQHRLGLSTTSLAFDLNLGCSGYVCGLAIVKSLIESGMGKCALFITADTLRKYVEPHNRGVSTLIGDGATATLIGMESHHDSVPRIGPFVFGTDGSGVETIIVRESGCRNLKPWFEERSALGRSRPVFHMDGPKVFEFALRRVPEAIDQLLEKAAISTGDIDRFVFHQANQFMLEHLRRKLRIPGDRFSMAIERTGNTSSSSIPLALLEDRANGQIKRGMTLMLVGFGAGYSWGACLVRL